MFKKSRIRIIAAIMAALLLFLIIALAVIYGSSFHQIQNENKELLSQFSDRFTIRNAETPPEPSGNPMEPQGSGMEGFIMPPTDEHDGGPGQDRHDKAHAFEVSTFYYAAISDTGEVLASDPGNGDLFTEDSLTETALDILESGKTSGKSSGMIYLVTDKDGYSLVAFMDTSVVSDNISTLMKYTMAAFGISVIVVFILSLFLSRKIIEPLEENDRRQKQFVSDAGHELKTPLAVMSANCELLEKELGSNPWLDNLEYENQRMSMLVKDLLDLSHAESGVLQEESIDLSNLVIGEALPFESIAFEKGLMLETQVTDGITTTGNPTQLKQLTAILVDNAIDHSEGGKDILLSLTSDKRHAYLKVTNSGPEIPEDKQALIFERFYRMDEARTGDDNHYGLGLAIAKAITKAHGGTININCSGGKVTFTAVIPIK